LFGFKHETIYQTHYVVLVLFVFVFVIVVCYSIESEFVIEHKKDVFLTEDIEHEIYFKKEVI